MKTGHQAAARFAAPILFALLVAPVVVSVPGAAALCDPTATACTVEDVDGGACESGTYAYDRRGIEVQTSQGAEAWAGREDFCWDGQHSERISAWVQAGDAWVAVAYGNGTDSFWGDEWRGAGASAAVPYLAWLYVWFEEYEYPWGPRCQGEISGSTVGRDVYVWTYGDCPAHVWPPVPEWPLLP